MRLIATCDVIVENFTRVCWIKSAWISLVQSVRPDAIMLRMRLRPRRAVAGQPAFAHVIEAAPGSAGCRLPDRNPYEPYSVGDPNAGVRSTRCWRWSIPPSGQGVHIEAAMVDAALNVAAEQVISTRRRGAVVATRREPRPDSGAPKTLPHQRDRRVRPARLLGGVAVATDEQWAGLRRAGDRTGRRPRAATADGRRRPRSQMSTCAWCEERRRRVVEALWSNGGRWQGVHRTANRAAATRPGFSKM